MLGGHSPLLWPSVQVIAVLAIALAASSATFWLLVRRATSHRQWVTFVQWAQEAGFSIERSANAPLPAPLDRLAAQEPQVLLHAATENLGILQLRTRAAATPSGAARSAEPITFNVLVRHLQIAWPPTGLRPHHDRRSLLDQFSLTSFPTLGTTERFVVFGTDSTAARLLSQSMARSLLPADVGLLLHGRELVLDFTDRPFDTIEFNRMIVLADQLAQKLPAPQTSPA